ncbi:hypothetical protein FHT82_006069 [Rhizobium sp. BK275]|uniref:cytochrome P460 family protein n=1 Tax=unclassified Rhizobium TaxID=2613769 RepID=UPI00160F4BAA|nr:MULTISPECIES: cytochrome P460 family protein [unclassified Rhizobium]MBB3393275.1 hypothetical protein [Rhizobium sp. BK275]MBB3412057.1 hypothetical protein [Rhizobium sp. BK316]
MKQIITVSLAAGLVTGLIGYDATASGEADAARAPALTTLPAGYRDWRLITVAHEEGKLDDIRAVLGNDIAITAFREGAATYPDGTIIGRLAWDYHPLEESKAAFGAPQSFVAGLPKNGVQFMVKDAKKFASTGGWGYVEFDDGKPSATAMPEACFACHTVVKDRDFVFSRYAP